MRRHSVRPAHGTPDSIFESGISIRGGTHGNDDTSPARRLCVPGTGRGGGGPAGRVPGRGGGGVLQHRGPLRLRQIHAAVRPGGAGDPDRRGGHRGRRTPAGPLAQGGLHAPAGPAVPLAEHLGQCDPGSGRPGGEYAGKPGPGPEPAGALRPVGLPG